MDILPCIYPLVSRCRFGMFYPLVNKNNAAMNIKVHIFMEVHILVSLVYILSSGITRSHLVLRLYLRCLCSSLLRLHLRFLHTTSFRQIQPYTCLNSHLDFLLAALSTTYVKPGPPSSPKLHLPSEFFTSVLVPHTPTCFPSLFPLFSILFSPHHILLI